MDKVQMIFDRAVFALNAGFPKTPGGRALLQDWSICNMYRSHVASLLGMYERFASHLMPPVLLCEIIRRCSWLVFSQQTVFRNTKAVQVSYRAR